jgi:ribosome-interacting GTPase 1
VIRPEGAAQLALIGPPNSGKSSLHARLTGSNAHVAAYPFTTQYPEPGMMPYEDIRFQLVDLPAVSREHPVPWLAGALQTADAALLVIDLADPACLEQERSAEVILGEKRLTLTEHWDGATAADDDPFARMLPTLMLANRADAIAGIEAELQAFIELGSIRYPAFAVSATTGQGLAQVGAWLFEKLHIVRIYTKEPGHPPDKGKPFTLRRGQTVDDLARLIHKDLIRTFKYARVWGHRGFDGQHVGHEHVLADQDVVELHA